ncbi:hypothetical protein [Chelativorans salis]|uniref:Uncharacterized protein n=1 Tax=Chelativorans salis TaxID=2978478 RepID=A0ABT2LK60_9HYPH|nr:hypothetical protein [Chelativorans sp. EGI FJ00035]MCT7374414.1 hypothetical protein [Chelativorans sp. EGI FJ00035]
MHKPVSVIDDHANVEETLQSMARVLGTDKVRRAVFNAVYGRHRKPAHIGRIMEIAGIDGNQKQQVRNALSVLSSNKVIVKSPPDSKRDSKLNHYEKSEWVNARKKKILDLADNKEKRETLPTKRKRNSSPEADMVTKITYVGARIRVSEITIDDIDSFKSVNRIEPRSSSLKGISEDEFKKGIQSIIGEEAIFKDWGGEKSDLLSTRVRLNGKRIGAAFAFKGPGQAGALTPARMGKNGDQALRLFEEIANLYVIQHWREIAQSVRVLIHSLAVTHSVMRNTEIHFCLIDGQDSLRIVDAYRSHFGFPATA